MRGRSPENPYGCLFGLLRFLRSWPEARPKVRIFNPDMRSHGWESRYTVVAILCRDMPFCTASVRGEINRRNLAIHTLSSCNLATRRDDEGKLLEVLAGNGRDEQGVSHESLLYFEVARHSDPDDLEDLRLELVDILEAVAGVVDDFDAMRNNLQLAQDEVRGSDCVEAAWREEALAFLEWLQHNHMTFLGYEYLAVSRDGGAVTVGTDKSRSLGTLRNRGTRGELDLRFDLERMDRAELQRRQLSFGKSRQRSRIHRLTYPDYVEVKVFDEAVDVSGCFRCRAWISPSMTVASSFGCWSCSPATSCSSPAPKSSTRLHRR